MISAQSKLRLVWRAVTWKHNWARQGTTTARIHQTLTGLQRVFVAITSEVVEPFPDRPTEGFFLFNTEFSPMASPSFEEGRPSEYAIELGRVIERGLRESRAIDTEALCIRSGEKVWKIKCNIIILDDGGNLLDCASIAAITALLHFRRPEVTTSGDTVQIVSWKTASF